MKATLCAPALLLLALAARAEAKGVAWCQVNGGKYQAYLSGMVEIDDGPEAFRALSAGFGKAFQDYVRTSFDPKASGADCTRQDSRFFAEDYIQVLINANPGYNFVKTGWRGGGSEAAAAAKGKRSSTVRAERLRFEK